MKGLGDAIADVREKKKWSQAELARRAGLSKGTISIIESGNTKSPRADRLAIIAQALDTPVSWFYEAAELTPATHENGPLYPEVRQLRHLLRSYPNGDDKREARAAVLNMALALQHLLAAQRRAEAPEHGARNESRSDTTDRGGGAGDHQ